MKRERETDAITPLEAISKQFSLESLMGEQVPCGRLRD